MPDMFLDPTLDPTVDPPPRADERSTLLAFLHRQRATFELRCSGLDAAAMARRAIEPSPLSLLGLVRHLADVERGWFRQRMARQDAPAHYRTEGNHDAAFDGAVPVPTVVADAWQVWRSEVAFAEQYIAAAPSLDLTGEDPRRGTISLRWVLIHLIEEYARHNGHVDLLRERIDGAVG
ncbi:MAG TPA: DinB family protein [Kineosporiaceae bacterium]